MRRPIKDIWLGTSLSSIMHGAILAGLLLSLPMLPMILDRQEPETQTPVPQSGDRVAGRAPALPSEPVSLSQSPVPAPRLGSAETVSRPRTSDLPDAIPVEIFPEERLPSSVKQVLARRQPPTPRPPDMAPEQKAQIEKAPQAPARPTEGPATPAFAPAPPSPARARSQTAERAQQPSSAWTETQTAERPEQSPRPDSARPTGERAAPSKSAPAPGKTMSPTTEIDGQASPTTATGSLPRQPAPEPEAGKPAPPTTGTMRPGGAGGSTASTGPVTSGSGDGAGLNARNNLQTVFLPPEATARSVEELVRLIDGATPALRQNAGLDPVPPPPLEDERRQEHVHGRIRQAAAHGQANAQYTLARMLLRGEGTARNESEAMEWLQRSAERGYLRAQLMLGYLAARGGLSGEGTPDLGKADFWWWAAEAQGNRLAKTMRAKLAPLMLSNDIARARQLKSAFKSLLSLLPPAMTAGDAMNETNDALRNAAAAGDIKSLLDALLKGADADGKDIDGKTAMINAAWRGRSEVIQILLDQGADIEVADNHSHTPLMWGAINGQTRVVERLIEAGARPGRVDDTGASALIRAAWNGHADIVAMLLRHGADPARRDKNGMSALDHARREGNREIVSLLERAAQRR